MRVGVAVGGFLLFVFAVLLTSVGLDGADSCANSASTSMLPFGLPGSLPCSYYRPIEYLGAGLLVVGFFRNFFMTLLHQRHYVPLHEAA